MTTEQEFLARVSARLGRKSPDDGPRPTWQPSLPLPIPGPSDPEVLAARFASELERIGGKAYRVGSLTEAGELAAGILQDQGLTGTLVRWDDPSLALLDPSLGAAGFQVVPFNGDLALAERAVAGITGCSWAIAETGTLVLSSEGRGRVVSLLPPIHIAVVRLEQLVYSAVSIFKSLAAAPMAAQVVFVSGPSRSADIENDLSIGVHGPGQVHVILA